MAPEDICDILHDSSLSDRGKLEAIARMIRTEIADPGVVHVDFQGILEPKEEFEAAQPQRPDWLW